MLFFTVGIYRTHLKAFTSAASAFTLYLPNVANTSAKVSILDKRLGIRANIYETLTPNRRLVKTPVSPLQHIDYGLHQAPHGEEDEHGQPQGVIAQGRP